MERETQFITEEFKRKINKNHLPRIDTIHTKQDFIQECWMHFLAQDVNLPLCRRIDNAFRKARNRLRPKQQKGSHIREVPVSNLDILDGTFIS